MSDKGILIFAYLFYSLGQAVSVYLATGSRAWTTASACETAGLLLLVTLAKARA